jgi:protein SCO1/2
VSRSRLLRRAVLLALGAVLVGAGCERRGDLSSGLSVWQLEGRWARAGDGEIELAALRGEPALLLLFYGTCQSICPALVHDLQTIEQELPPAARAQLRFVLVTIDPEHDTVERLAGLARDKGLDPERWALLRGTPDQVRELAAAVGVRYRATGNGQFAHTARIVLLDRDGVEREHWDGLDRPLDPIVSAATELAGRS